MILEFLAALLPYIPPISKVVVEEDEHIFFDFMCLDIKTKVAQYVFRMSI